MSPKAKRVRARLCAEEGITIIFAIALLTIGLAVGAAALAETLSSRSHTNLDARERRALQAADYGVQAALYHANQLNLDSLDLTGGSGVLGKLADCIVPKITSEGAVSGWETLSPSSGGACPTWKKSCSKTPCESETIGFVEIGNHDSYEAEFIPNEKVATGGSSVSFVEPKIISIGLDDSGSKSSPGTERVYARVEANLASVEPFKTVEAGNNLTFKVSAATVFNGTARAGHEVIFKGEGLLLNTFTGTNLLGSGEKVVGPPLIEYGCKAANVAPEDGLLPPNVTVTPTSMLKHVEETGERGCEKSFFNRPQVTVSGSKADWSSPTGSVTCSSPTTGYEANREKGVGTQDAIFIENEKTLELTPGCDYVFCSFVTNGPVTLPAGTSDSSLPVRIFIDNPTSSRCANFVEHTPEREMAKKLKEATGSEVIKAGSFVATKGIGELVGGATQTLSPSQLQIYMSGNGSDDATSFSSSATGSDAFFLYAPQSKVTLSSKAFSGALDGYDVTVSTTLYSQDIGLDNYPLSSTAGVFRVSGYTQCALDNASGTSLTSLTGTVATDASGC